MISTSKSLAFTIAVGLAAIAAAVSGGFAWLTIRADRQQQYAQLRFDQKVLADQLAVGLAQPVWNFDRAQIVRIMESALADEKVVAVMVRPNDVGHSVIGRLREPAGTVRLVENESQLPAGLERVVRPIESGRDPLGQVEVYVTTRLVEEALQNELILRLWRTVVLDVVLMAAVYGLLWWWLLRPMKILEGEAMAISHGRDTTPAMAAKHFRGEMESLRASLLGMLRTMQERYEELVRAESRFRDIVDNSGMGMGLFDSRGVMVEINPALCRSLGYSREELLGMDPMGIIHPDDLPQSRTDTTRLIAGEIEGYRHIKRYRCKDGHYIWVDISMNALRDRFGQVVHFFLQTQDITQRKLHEQEIERLNRLYLMLSKVNQTLVRASIQAEIFQEVCEALVDTGHFKLAWIGWLDPATMLLAPAAAAGAERDYIAGLRISADPDVPEGQGPSGRAFRENRAYVCNDFFADPATQPWREPAARAGIRASMALPLRRENQTMGLLTVYAGEKDFFQPQEIKLLEKAADNISFALDVFASRARRQEAEVALHHSQNRLQFLLTATPAVIFSLRASGDFGTTFISGNVFEVLGYRPEAFTADAKFWREHLHPDDLAVAETSFASFATVGVLGREYRFRHQDGAYRWMREEMRLVRDSQGQPQEIVGYWLDVTERKTAELQLIDLTERLRLAVEIGRLGVWQHWPRLLQTSWDARTHELFGVELGGEPTRIDDFVARVHPDDRDAYLADWAVLLKGGRTLQQRFRYLLPGGSYRHVEAHALVHRDAAGNPEWVLGVNIDLTEVVTATTNAERYRTQLIQSQKMETLGQLAGGIAHDFNNLLTGINGFVELAAQTLPAEHESIMMLDQAKRAANNARDLVRRILSFSRQAPAGARAPLRLSDTVRDTAPLVSTLLPPTVSLRLELADKELPVLADSGQIQQIIMNLCANAAHAMGKSKGLLTILVDVREFPETAVPSAGVPRGGPQVRLRICDTGCGMSPETLSHIFEPFFTTKKAGEGTGLGMAIVQGIIQEHGGTIGIESELGRGTTFTMLFPSCEAASPGQLPDKTVPVPSRGNEHILVIDDEPTVVTLAATILKRAGYNVVSCSTPQEAWRTLAQDANRFDLVLTDYNMPDMTGLEFAQRARALVPDLAVLIMTANLELVEFADEDRIPVLKKPFEMTELLSAVRKQLHPD